jgi:Uma2 family endonuclease
MPVHLWSGKYREPDVVYFLPHRVKDVHGQPEGADLVVEVVSEEEENRNRDLETKRQEYVFSRGTTATSVLLPGFSASVDAVFAAGRINQ